MKKSVFVLLGFVCLPVWAAQVTFTEEAEVVSVEPRMREVRTHVRECWDEEVPVHSAGRSRSYAGAAIGGVTGGLLGSRVGKGNGRTAAAAVGAAIGAVVGDHIDNNDGSRSPAGRYRSEQRCSTTPRFESQQDGYTVVVRFRGRDMAFQTREAPGYGMIPLTFMGTVTLAH